MQTRAEYQRDWARRKRANVDNKPQSVDKPVNNVDTLPADADKAMWAYCVERAQRATRYAVKFPHLIRPSEVRFQDPAWQYADQSRFPIPVSR